MSLAPVNFPDWWLAAEEVGWYVGRIGILDTEVVVEARSLGDVRRRSNDTVKLCIARTDDAAVMMKAMQTMLRMEGGPQ